MQRTLTVLLDLLCPTEEENLLRKTPPIVLGLLASVVFTGGAVAQAPEPSHTLQMGVTPSKAGTAKNPKALTKLKLSITNDKAAKTTASKIEISLPKTIRFNTKGFTTCSAAKLDAEGPAGCSSKSRLGVGTASAVLGPTSPTPAPLEFKNTFFVGSATTLNIFLEQTGGDVRKLLIGKISNAGGKYGQKLSIAIPGDLQQPVPGTYSALSDIATSLSGTAGSGSKKHGILESRGCVGGKYAFQSKLTYAPNPDRPAARTSTATDTVSCKK
ncbi:MAG: hypothetical protein H0V22_00175 [Solirubrobacterales bacterium]|nr:hypothetical protein [Solirubrobacterales bacterium]